MRNLRHVIAISLAAATTLTVAAPEHSGPTKRLCAITSTLTCDVANCIQGPATAVNLPVFVKIDTESNLIETATQRGDRRSSKITNARTEGDTLVLLGGELERGWSMVLDQAEGSFTGTVADNGVGYIIFGSCLAY